MPINYVISRSVTHANEDGTETTKVIDVMLNAETAIFSVDLPPYLVDQNGDAFEPMTISAETAKRVIDNYEIRCEEYSRWRLGMNAPTMLWIGIQTKVGDFARTAFGISSVCAIGATPVKVLPGRQMVAVLPDGKIAGPVGSKGSSFEYLVLVEDTPEHRAKVEALADSIQRAADILEGLILALNPSEYLMAIGDDWRQPTAPKQGELDLEPVVTEPVVTEDDEL